MGALQYMLSGHGKTTFKRTCPTILADTPQAIVICMNGYRKKGRKDHSLEMCSRCLKSHYAKERQQHE